jgi:C-terminal processing protease CtpA/Prc
MKNIILISIFSLFLLNGIGYSQTKITFNLESLPHVADQKVGIRGDTFPLDWSKSIVLNKTDENYTIDLEFPFSKKEIEFKFVTFSDDNNPTWETIANRTLILQAIGKNKTSNNKWNREQVIDINSLKKIEVDKLLADYELIKTMVLDVHPGTYRYNNEAEISLTLEELKNKFSNPLTHQEVYLAISKLTAQIKCDHTKAGFNNQSKLINSIIHYQNDKVPFTFKWIGNEMVVINNASESELLVKGTKILSINQIPVIEIRKQLLFYIGADGATDQNRTYKSQVNGYDFRYNAFDIFYPLIYPLKSEKLALEIQQPDKNTVESIIVSAMSREDRFKILTERYPQFPKSRDEMWDFNILSDSTAILKINSFGLSGWKAITIDYKAYLANVFKQIDELSIQHLIIDIRENIGGNDEMANELFTYIADKNYNFEREGRSRYIDFPETLRPYIKTWNDNPWYYKLNPNGTKTTNGYYIFKDNFTQPISKSDKKVYQGKLYLLISSANTSLAFYTAYRFKLQQLGITLGQETGGNLNDINGGNILFLNLPNSNIEIDFPIMGGFSGQKQPNTGVIPDIKLNYIIQDILENRDLEVEKVIELINK